MNNSPQTLMSPPWRRDGTPPFERLQIEIEGKIRQFSAWIWEGRVAFQDDENPFLCWVTLDVLNATISAREFWHQALNNRQVGRYIEVIRGLSSRTEYRKEPYNSRLVIAPFALRLIVDEQNRGWVSHVDGLRWYHFAPKPQSYAIRSRSKTLDILSPYRSFKFVDLAGRALISLESDLARERLSELQWALWQEGATHQFIRLLEAALQAGVAKYFNGSVREFWETVFNDFSSFSRDALPSIMGVEGYLYCSLEVPQYIWREEKTQIYIALCPEVESIHEQLEAYGKLRDLLLNTLTAAQVAQLMHPFKAG